MRIMNNIAAMGAYRNLNTSGSSMEKSLEKLSSGFRINRASDDAAGLVISQGLRAQISGQQQASRNAQDGISVVQTAEGALTEVHSMLNRMRDLAVQTANTSSQDTDSISAATAEYNQLSAEITRIAESTSFGGQNLLDGSFGKTDGKLSGFVTAAADFDGDETFDLAVTGGSGTVTVTLDDTAALSGKELATYLEGKIKTALAGSGDPIDAAAAESFSIDVETVGAGFAFTMKNSGDAAIAIADGTNTPFDSDLTLAFEGTVAAATGDAKRLQVGANSGQFIEMSIEALDSVTLGVDGADLAADSQTAIDNLDAAIKSVSTQRGTFGAIQNRLESTINNLQVSTENLTAAESRIRDTDMALEMTNFTKQQVLQQAGVAMLGQANGLSSSVLRLLG